MLFKDMINEEKDLQTVYQEYFARILKKYNVESPAELETEEMKKFFDEVSSGWEKGKGEK